MKKPPAGGSFRRGRYLVSGMDVALLEGELVDRSSHGHAHDDLVTLLQVREVDVANGLEARLQRRR